MKNDLVTAKTNLQSGKYTCVAVKNQEILTSTEHGIRPIIYWFRGRLDFFQGACVADKVIGKAAALLFAYGEITKLYADVMSKPALDACNQYGINCSYGKLVDSIRNRDNTDMCPMEKRALNIETPADAYSVFNEMIK